MAAPALASNLHEQLRQTVAEQMSEEHQSAGKSRHLPNEALIARLVHSHWSASNSNSSRLETRLETWLETKIRARKPNNRIRVRAAAAQRKAPGKSQLSPAPRELKLSRADKHAAQVKQMMEEAVTRREIYDESASVLALCGESHANFGAAPYAARADAAPQLAPRVLVILSPLTLRLPPAPGLPQWPSTRA